MAAVRDVERLAFDALLVVAAVVASVLVDGVFAEAAVWLALMLALGWSRR